MTNEPKEPELVGPFKGLIGPPNSTVRLLLLLCLLSCAVSTASAIALPASHNLLVNPGFEDGTMRGWTLGLDYCGVFGDNPCSPWHVTADDSHSGNNSLLDLGDTEVLQFFSPTPGTMVTEVSFWLKQSPAVAFGYGLFYSDGSTTFAVIFPEDDTWKYYNVTASVDPSKFLDGIAFVNYSSWEGNGPAWLDDVLVDPPTIERTPEPGCLFLLSSGLLSFVWLAPKVSRRGELGKNRLASLDRRQHRNRTPFICLRGTEPVVPVVGKEGLSHGM